MWWAIPTRKTTNQYSTTPNHPDRQRCQWPGRELRARRAGPGSGRSSFSPMINDGVGSCCSAGMTRMSELSSQQTPVSIFQDQLRRVALPTAMQRHDILQTRQRGGLAASARPAAPCLLDRWPKSPSTRSINIFGPAAGSLQMFVVVELNGQADRHRPALSAIPVSNNRDRKRTRSPTMDRTVLPGLRCENRRWCRNHGKRATATRECRGPTVNHCSV